MLAWGDWDVEKWDCVVNVAAKGWNDVMECWHGGGDVRRKVGLYQRGGR